MEILRRVREFDKDKRLRRPTDSIGGRDQSVNGQWIEENKTLMEMIINSKKETIKNMQE